LASRDDVRPVTVEGYRHSLAYLTRETRPFTYAGHPLPGKRVQHITREHIEALKAWMLAEGGQHGQPLGPNSIKHTLVALRQVFEYAIQHGVIKSNPCEHVRAPRKTGGNRKSGQGVAYWSPDEARKFAAHVESDRLAAAWRLALCGFRRSEILGLQWDAIDWEESRVQVGQGRVLVSPTETAIDDVKRSDSDRRVPVDVLWPGTIAALRRLQTAVRAYPHGVGAFGP
jgi:integrase